MSNFANQVTSPFGLKLFSGPPYGDAGAGDKLQANLDTYMKQLAPIIQQISSSAGVANPLTGAPGVSDPFSLNPLQQGELNRIEGIGAQSTDQAIQGLLAHLSARGLGQSSLAPAGEAYLRSNLIGQQEQEQLQAGESAFQNRMNANQMIAQLLQGLFSAQQGVTQQQGQTALQAHEEGMTNAGNFLGFLLGKIPGLGGGAGGVSGGTPPITDASQIVGALPAGGNVNVPWGNTGFMPTFGY